MCKTAPADSLSHPKEAAEAEAASQPGSLGLSLGLWLICGVGCTGICAIRREGVGATVLVKGASEGKTNKMREASISDCCS